MTNQSQNKIVLVGTDEFTFDLPFTEEIEVEVEERYYVGIHEFTVEEKYEEEKYGEEGDEEKGSKTVKIPGFEAVFHLSDLDELRKWYQPPFTYVQVVCVTIVKDYELQCWSPCTFLISEGAVDWILCFPVDVEDDEDEEEVCFYDEEDDEEQGPRYVLRTNTVPPDGDDIFYTFKSAVRAASSGVPVQAVADLGDLKFLSPRPWDKLAVVRASDWSWDKQKNTAFILPQDILKVEIVAKSKVCVFLG